MSVIINEFSYDGMAGDFIEIRAPAGTDVSDLVVETYTKSGSTASRSQTLELPDDFIKSTIGGFDYYVPNTPVELENGPRGAITLVDTTTNTNIGTVAWGGGEGIDIDLTGGLAGPTTLQSIGNQQDKNSTTSLTNDGSGVWAPGTFDDSGPRTPGDPNAPSMPASMGDYSIWVLGESNISITNGVSLDGITQGDGSHLVGEYLTINTPSAEEVFVSDGGSETNFSDNDNNQRLAGDQRIDGISYSDNTRIEAEYQFVLRDNATGLEYTAVAVNLDNSNPRYATNEAIAFIGTAPPAGVALEVVSAQEGPPNSGPNAVDASEIVPICFCRGTLIETPSGPKPVEELGAGDQVCRPNKAPATLRRVFVTKLGQDQLDQNAKLRPVRLTAGSLGMARPQRDLLVSRQHRVLVSSDIARRMFGQKEVLIAAIKLTEMPGIFVDDAVEEAEYFHLLFDKHEIIFSEGVLTESLYTGPEALKAVGPEARQEIMSLFPDMADGRFAAEPARFIPSGKLQKKLVQRHLRNEKPLSM